MVNWASKIDSMREFLAIPTLTLTTATTLPWSSVWVKIIAYFLHQKWLLYVYSGNFREYFVVLYWCKMPFLCCRYMTCKSILPAGLQFLKRKLNFPNILLLCTTHSRFQAQITHLATSTTTILTIFISFINSNCFQIWKISPQIHLQVSFFSNKNSPA